MRLVRVLPEIPASDDTDTSLLTADILPGWTAAWIAVERERFRQLRLHADRGAQPAADRRRAASTPPSRMAELAARSAPSRESARRVLIEAHLAQGNIAAAVAEYDSYHELLRSSVGGPAPSGLEGLLPPMPAWPVLSRPVPDAALGGAAARPAFGARRVRR